MPLTNEQRDRAVNSCLEMLGYARMLHHGDNGFQALMATSPTDPLDLATAGVLLAEMTVGGDALPDDLFEARLDALRDAVLKIGVGDD